MSDPAARALHELGARLDRTIAELTAARERVAQLERQRAGGRGWCEIVAAEERPLLVETVTRSVDELVGAASRFRREEARALHGEDLSLTRIGALFGVSRQRVSAILAEPR